MLRARASQWEDALIWKRLFGRGEGENDTGEHALEAPLAEEQVEDREVDRQLDAALDWLDDSTARLHAGGLGNFERFDVDLAAGRIVFSGDDGMRDFACQAVGTFNEVVGTWHWAWDHPSIPADMAGASEHVRQFGLTHNLGAFTERQIAASPNDVWQFAGLAGLLSHAAGVYRCPGDGVDVYVVLYEID